MISDFEPKILNFMAGIIYESWAGHLKQTIPNAWDGQPRVDAPLKPSYGEACVLANAAVQLARVMGVVLPQDPCVRVWEETGWYRVDVSEAPEKRVLAQLRLKKC